jgi:tRNA(Leu) C34 or U34 (ribose-2'-O)-methylase TrmL
MDTDLPDEMRHSPRRRKRLDRHVSRQSTLTERGYGCVALDHPTDGVNVGHTLRAALCFEARMVIIGGRPPELDVRRLNTDPGRAYRHIPVLHVDDIFEAMPEDCTPVAVELTDDAVDLPNFVHPERACYVFGPENGSITPEVMERCPVRVKIPTTMSLNLGMTVNIVLYDRMAKMRRAAPGEPLQG